MLKGSGGGWETDSELESLVSLRAVGLSVVEFQRLARENLAYLRCKRVSCRIVSECRRLVDKGSLETANRTVKAGLDHVESLLSLHRKRGFSDESLPFWFHVRFVELLFLQAEGQLGMGRLLSTLRIVERVIEYCNQHSLDQLYLARAFQFRSWIKLTVGADSLAKSDATEALRYLHTSHQCSPARHSGHAVDVALAKNDALPQMLDSTVTFTAADWHRTRRKLIIEAHPQVKEMFEENVGQSIAGEFQAVAILALVLVHLAFMQFVGERSLWIVVFCAATVGAWVCYGFQALNHDLSHISRNRGVNYLCMILSSALCNFPWAMYYQQYHAIHHAFTGSDMDRDGDILFQPWHSPPLFVLSLTWPLVQSSFRMPRWSEYFNSNSDEESTDCKEKSRNETTSQASPPRVLRIELDLASHWLLRYLWTIVVPTFLFPMFLVRKALLDRPHLPSVEYEGLMFLGHILCFRLGGWNALLYLWLSASFSLGGFCHPFFGFWLIQHQSSTRTPNIESHLDVFHAISLDNAENFKPQPTVSYSGSIFWHLLNFGELWHVEHHDFPFIPAILYPKLREIAAEFYQDLEQRDSIFRATLEWLFTPSDEDWMQQHGDFARRDAFIDDVWIHQYQHPEDTKESAEKFADKAIATLTGKNPPFPCCSICKAGFRPRVEDMIVSAYALSCDHVLVHRSCLKTLQVCPQCEEPIGVREGVKPYLLRCFAGHEIMCLSTSPCEQCALLYKNTSIYRNE